MFASLRFVVGFFDALASVCSAISSLAGEAFAPDKNHVGKLYIARWDFWLGKGAGKRMEEVGSPEGTTSVVLADVFGFAAMASIFS